MKNKNIELVGLGRMSGNMARCLKDKDYNVSALFDIKESVASELTAEISTTAYSKFADAEGTIICDHDCYFSAPHAAKDSSSTLGLAAHQHINAPIALATLVQYTKRTEMGKGILDKSGIAELTFKGRG